MTIKDMPTYQARLAFAMRLRRKNANEVAGAVGKISYQAIQHLCNADAKVKGSKHTAAISRFLNCDPQWLAVGSGKAPSKDDPLDLWSGSAMPATIGESLDPRVAQIFELTRNLSNEGLSIALAFVEFQLHRENPRKVVRRLPSKKREVTKHEA